MFCLIYYFSLWASDDRIRIQPRRSYRADGPEHTEKMKLFSCLTLQVYASRQHYIMPIFSIRRSVRRRLYNQSSVPWIRGGGSRSPNTLSQPSIGISKPCLIRLTFWWCTFLGFFRSIRKILRGSKITAWVCSNKILYRERDSTESSR